jgi:hypothetical protein
MNNDEDAMEKAETIGQLPHEARSSHRRHARTRTCTPLHSTVYSAEHYSTLVEFPAVPQCVFSPSARPFSPAAGIQAVMSIGDL